MIALGSLVGFGLVFLTASVGASLVFTALALGLRSRLAATGAAVERKAAAWALVLPPLIGLAVTSAIIGHSLVGRSAGVPDHCPSDLAHLHLCLYHGAAWATRPWAVLLLSAVSLVAFVRAATRVGRLVKARRDIGTLRALAKGAALDGEVLIVPAERHFCFSAGIVERRIFVSSAAWVRLDPLERRAVVAHERAHVQQGDVWRRAALGLVALVGAPVLTALVLRCWEQATERLCDRRAADVVGDPTVVARALMAFAGSPRLAGNTGAAFAEGHDIVGRIEALLAGTPEGTEAARRLGHVAMLAAGIAAALSVVAADPLHHAFETLLSM